DYSFPVWAGWTGRVGGGFRWVGDRTSGLEGSRTSYPEDSYGVLDLNADVSNDRWTVRLYMKNVTDERVYSNLPALPNAATGVVSRVTGVPLQPRTIGIGFDAKF